MTESIQERVAQVQAAMAEACARAGRDVQDVGLVAVSKTFPPEYVAEAVAAGLTVFGESKVQEAAQKIPLCPARIAWHMVGHLQTNKVRHAVHLFRMIHSVDSWKLLEAIDRACDESGARVQVCIEVNVSGERSKFGLPPADVPAVLEKSTGLMRVSVAGLMTVPPFDPDPEKTRPFFATLRELREGWRAQTGLALDGLSMGMSHDFRVAIEEGATWVRVGSSLFGERPKRQPPVGLDD